MSDDVPAAAHWTGGTRVRTSHPDDMRFATDLASELGGTGDQVSPGWLMRASLAACAATFIAMKAAEQGIALASLEVRTGLTHGGFYRHFDSRDAFVAEAVERALQDGRRAVDAIAARRQVTFAGVVDAYLNLAHRDALATSCALPTLASDVARSNERGRNAYAR